ncbi:MAG: Xaa-Pro dipeptidase [Steroidobacteraceae bacterium]|nr:Xaa-Pro dipeptidase [Steroidobacteraceae bacterium]
MPELPSVDAHYPAHLAIVQARADHALELSGHGALAIGAGLPLYQFLDDQPYPFKVNPHFKAWVPVLAAPGSMLFHVPGRRPLLAFLQPEDYWHEPPRLPTDDWTRHVDIAVIRESCEARRLVPPGCAFLGEPFSGIEEWGFAAVNPQAAIDSLHYARAAKTAYELDCMRLASRLGAAGHRAAAEAFAARASEYEIHLAYLKATGHCEEQLPYPNIIGLNEGGGILHYTDLKRARPAEHRSLLIDAGAQYRGYACDITRSYAGAAGLYAELVAAMDALQLELCSLVRPGIDYAAIHHAAHAAIGALLARLGLVRCSGEAAVANGLTKTFFPHGIGHLIGLQVHDVGGFMASERGGTIDRPAGHPYLRLTRRLEPGTVVTIEPGIYFVDLLLDEARRDGRGRDVAWNVVEALKPYGGVRIEDDVVATAAGPENLTRPAFAALAA